MDVAQSMTLPDHRWWIVKKWQAAWAWIKWQTYLYVYCCYIYRPQMKIMHRFGKHQWTHLHPIGGPRMDWCQWCGVRRDVQ